MEINTLENPVKTIFLAEGERHVLDALRLMLEEKRDLEILGEAQSAEVLLTKVCKNAPDIILLDWDLPGIHHLRLIAALRVCCPAAQLIALSVKPEYEKSAKEYGLDGFISKQLSAEAFMESLNHFIAKIG
jgi:DNA-binding NarL/FixJ family response regulator